MNYTEDQLREKVLSDPRFAEMGALPSHFHPYDWKKLYARPFERAELQLLSRAIATGELANVLRAVDIVISEDVLDLTTYDFYYVMLWLRSVSMPKAPYTVSWDCNTLVLTNPENNEFIFGDRSNIPESEEEQRKYTEFRPCGFSNTSVVHHTKVELICLPDPDDAGKEGYVPFVPLPEGWDFPRVRTMVEEEEYAADPDFVMILKSLRWMKGNTFKEKLDRFDSMGLDVIQQAKEIIEGYEHGYAEEMSFLCGRCRTKHERTVQVDALSFFQ